MPLFRSCLDLFRARRKPQPPLAFVHLYKTAGTSMNLFLVNRFPAGQCWRMYPEHGQTYRDLLPPRPVGCYSGHLRYGEMLSVVPRGTTVFTVVRNPIERAISAYYGCRRQSREVLRQRDPAFLPALDLSLAEFIRTRKQLAIGLFGNFQTNYFGRDQEVGRFDDGTFVPPTRKDLAKARDNLSRCLVGTTERLDEFVGLLCRERGWPEPARAPLANQTPRRPREVELDRDVRDFLQEHTALDDELHRFAGELLQERLRKWDGEPRPAPRPARAWQFTFDRPIPGYGWHQRQTWEGVPFCFTEPQAWLDGGTLAGRELRVEIDTLPLLPPEHASPFRLRINDREVGLTRTASRRGDTHVGVLPWGGVKEVRLELEALNPARPSDLLRDSRDARLIGLAVAGIRLASQ
jgi:hypothetical protein